METTQTFLGRVSAAFRGERVFIVPTLLISGLVTYGVFSPLVPGAAVGRASMVVTAVAFFLNLVVAFIATLRGLAALGSRQERAYWPFSSLTYEGIGDWVKETQGFASEGFTLQPLTPWNALRWVVRGVGVTIAFVIQMKWTRYFSILQSQLA